jgi:hypothetical protein
MFSLTVFQAILISTSLPKFSKAANMIQVSIGYCSLPSTSSNFHTQWNIYFLDNVKSKPKMKHYIYQRVLYLNFKSETYRFQVGIIDPHFARKIRTHSRCWSVLNWNSTYLCLCTKLWRRNEGKEVLKFLIQRLSQYREYSTLVMGWLMNMEELVE